ncbi:MAG: DNA gyrase subunit A, partial [Clostridia bacterium]|nr:DNA gyrase subunit A [Clostridia bacterium]
TADAVKNLMEKYGLTDVQAQAIVQMRLRQLTGLEREKIENEIAELRIKIADFIDILGSEQRRLQIVKDEAITLRNKYDDPRRTEICAISGEVDIEDLIPKEECVVTYTRYGYIKRQTVDTYKLQNRGGRGVSGMTRREEDFASEMFTTGSHDYILFFSDLGRVYRLKCYEIPEGSRQSKGINIANLLPVGGDEKITAMVRIPEFAEDLYLNMVTKKGIIKRILLSAYDTNRKGGLIALELNEGDSLVGVQVTSGDKQLMIATKKGMSIRFDENDVRPMGRQARGVKALKLKEDDEVVSLTLVGDDALVLTVSETGYGRISPAENYRLQSRGGKGITNYHTEKYGDVAAVKTINLDEDIIMVNADGVIIRIAAESVRVCARPSKGVTVMRIKEGNKVVAVVSAPHEESAEVITEIPDTSDAAEAGNEAETEE